MSHNNNNQNLAPTIPLVRASSSNRRMRQANEPSLAQDMAVLKQQNIELMERLKRLEDSRLPDTRASKKRAIGRNVEQSV